MNRAEKRRRQRSQKDYEVRNSFTKRDLEISNEKSYDLGVKHTLEAMRKVLGVGKVRQERVEQELKRIQHRDFIQYFEEAKK